MNETPVHVLLIEDNPGDARLIQELMVDVGVDAVHLEWANCLQAGIDALAQTKVDGILLDLSLPDSQGLETFNKMYAHAPSLPIIVLSGIDQEELSLNAVREGAQDYLVKGEVDGNLLVRSLRYAIERKRLVKQTEQRAREISALYTVTAAISGSLDLNQILAKTLATILNVTGMEMGYIRLLEGNPPQLKLMAHQGIPPQLVEILRRGPRRGGRSERILATKKSVTYKDPPPEHTGEPRNHVTAEGFNVSIGVPIILKERAVGIISVGASGDSNLSHDQVSLLESIGSSLGIALENATLFTKAQKGEEIQRLLKELSQDITALDIDSLLKKLTQKVTSLVGVDVAEVSVLKGGTWQVKGMSGTNHIALAPRDDVMRGRSAWIVNNRRALMIPDITKAGDTEGDTTLKSLGIRGYLGLPLFSRKREVTGVLRVLSHEPKEFTQEEMDLLQQLANGVAVAIENAQLFDEIQQKSNELEALVKINRDIAKLLDQETLLPRIAEEAKKLLKMDSASFRLIEGDSLVISGSVGIHLERRSRLPIEGSLSGKLIRENRTLVIKDISKETSIGSDRRRRLNKAGYRSCLGAPLQMGGRSIGIINLYSKMERDYSKDDIELIVRFADQAAIALENARLYEETKRQAAQLQQDIAQRKLTESQLRQVNADLKQSHEELKAAQLQVIRAAKLESVGRLAAGVAHEVKNPLEIILMCVEYLSNHLVDRDEQTAVILEDIDYAVRRADTVIKGLLDFSSSEELRTSKEKLNEIIDKTLLLVKHDLDRSHISLIKAFSENLPSMQLDRNKIEQVFLNLFMNAIHAMPKGGTLTARTHKRTLTEDDFNECLRKPAHCKIGETVVVTDVEDTGVGIPEDRLEKVFDPFFTTKPTGEGTGLGLTVVSKIIDLHHGMIDIRNRKEGGVRARVMFTVQKETTHDEETNPSCG